MSWVKNLGSMAKTVVDFTGVPGLIKDLSTSGSNDDPWYIDGVNFVKNTVKVATTPVRAAVTGLFAAGEASYELGGKVRREGVEAILDQPFMYNKFKAPGESYSDYTLRVENEKENISPFQAALSVLSPGRTSGDRSGWFQEWTDNNLKFMSTGFDVFNQEDRDTAFRDQYTGKFLSGIGDFTTSVIVDPLTFAGFLGKGAVIIAKAPMLDQIQGKTARAVFGKFAMTEERLDNILIEALDGKGEALTDIDFLVGSNAREQYKYWRKKKVTNPDAMAYLFGRAASREEVVDTFRAVMYRDPKSISTIASKDEEAAFILDASNPISHPQRQFLEGKTDGDLITSQEYNRATGSYIAKLTDEASESYDQRFATALADTRTGGQLKYGFSRGPWEGKLAQKSKKDAQATFAEADSVIFQKTSLHPIIKVVNYFTKELPSGVFNVHDGDSYIEFNAFLREANELSKGRFGAQGADYADQYLASVTQGDRNRIIQQAEKSAMAILFPNYDQQTIDKLYMVFDSRRASRIKQHRDQGFVSYLENGQVVNAISPILQRESANIVIIADLRKLKRAIDTHESILPGLLDGLNIEDLTLRTKKGLSTLATFNDIFKTSVLMRLGYTVRNLTEAQLSMMAKGFALPAMVAAGGPEAVKRFFTNRKVGFNRLIDNVNVSAGRLDDINTLNYQFASGTDRLRSIEMSKKELAKAVADRIGDLEKDIFKLRLTPGVGPLTAEDEIRTLRGVLSDLESVTLYHGSADAAFQLNEAKVLATSASPAIAARYSEGFTIHSTENYLETPTGARPGRLGQKPTDASGQLKPLVEEEEIKRLNPNMKEDFGNITNAALVKTDYIKKFIEFDRAGSQATPDYSAKTIANITDDLKSGKGFTDPLILDYYVSDSGELLLKLGEGNHRLQAALKAGLDSVPVAIVKGSPNTRNLKFTGITSKIIPDKIGYIPGNPNPRELLESSALKDLRVFPKGPTVKRAAALNEASDNLLTDMIAAKNAGKEVEMRTPKGWKTVESLDWKQIRLAEEGALEVTPELFRRSVFRVKGEMNKPVPVRVYGEALYLTKWSDIPLDLRESAFGGSINNYKQWTKDKGWSNNNDPVVKYMREKGFGRVVVQDDARAGGVSNIVLPEAVAKTGRQRAVERSITEMKERSAVQAAEDLPILESKMDTPKQRRLARTAARKAARLKETSVSPYYTRENVDAMINNGVEDAAENLAKLYTMEHAYLDDISSRLGARIDRAETNAVKQRTGYGYNEMTINGVKYTVPNTFQDATWFMGRTSAEDTWNALIGSQEMAFSTGMGARTVSILKPNDPKYFEGWSNILNLHFRDPETGIMDPLVRRILDGETDQDILNWFTRTKDGRLYANDTYTTPRQAYGLTAIRGGELDEDLLEKINITRGAVKLYIPDEQTALFLSTATPGNKPLSGAELQNYLRERFGVNPENLPDINGLLVTSSKEFRDQERLIDTFNRRVMRFLGSLPEDVFARHPLAVSNYNRQVKTNIQNIADAKGTDKLTAEEINSAIRGAREDSRRTVEQTLFTIVRRSRASSSQIMQLMFPFFAAYENTVKRWSGIVAENPQAVTTAARTIAQVVNGQTVVDQEGNRITDAKDLAGGKYANLVVQVPQGFIDSLPKDWQEIANNAFKSVNIPLSSLDVITQGQPGNPGFGPYAVLPAYLILRARPELEEAFKPLFPAGLPQSASSLFTPAAFRRLSTMWTQDALYVRTFNQMLRYETYNYNAGSRTDEPTLDEITDKTNKFFLLRALGSISLPFAVSPEMDFYQQTFRQFLNQYGPGEAEAKFLEMYPDYFEATVSLSKSPGSLESNMDTVRNLKKFRGLMAEAESSDNPELIGFLANDFDGQYTFSQAAYQWQYRQGAYPGSKNTYRQNRAPEELLRDADIKRGWTQFNSLMGQINTYKIQNGIVADSDPRMDIINGAKQLWVRSQAEENFDWYSEYISPDRGKYERRALVLKKALSDKAWMAQNGDRSVVKAMSVYLDLRDQMASVLKQRDRAGGSQTLSAKSNADLTYVFEQVRQQLIAESPEFEQFLNRYFINDTVVV